MLPITLSKKAFIHKMPLVRQPIVDPIHKVPLVALDSDSYLQISSLLMAVLMRWLFTLNPPPDVESKPSSPPSSSVPSEGPVAIDSCPQEPHVTICNGGK